MIINAIIINVAMNWAKKVLSPKTVEKVGEGEFNLIGILILYEQLCQHQVFRN